MIDQELNTVTPEVITKDQLSDLKKPPTEKKALIKMSKDPAGLQVFIDKSKAGKLKYTLDVVKCIELYMKGVTIKDIAATQNLNGNNRRVINYIRRMISLYKPNIDMTALAVYKEHRTEFLQQKQKEIMEAITPEKIAEASLKDLTFAHDKLFANERLNDNKATANVAHQFAAIVEQIHGDRNDDE